MADRRWTVMVVPHGSDSPRSFSISERVVRFAIYVGCVLGIMAIVGVGITVTSTSRLVSRVIRPRALHQNRLAAHAVDRRSVKTISIIPGAVSTRA